jgi:uncharacterized protein YjbJ (UPF0337 family)
VSARIDERRKETEEPTMSGTTDQAKGRLKEAAGAITDDDKLRREGKLDQAVGKVKDAAEKALDAVTDKIKGKG